MKDLVIVGAGGHGREMLQCVADINAQQTRWNVLGFVDDGSSLRELASLPVLGTTAWLRGRDCHVVVAIGAPAVRRRVVHALLKAGVSRFATLIHPSTQVGASVVAGEGSMLCAGAILTTDIELGSHVIVNTGAVVSHDARLADFVTLAPRACLCGDVHLGEGVELGATATVVPGVRVGAWAIAGAGATVLQDVGANEVVAGVPARSLRTNIIGWQDKG